MRSEEAWRGSGSWALSAGLVRTRSASSPRWNTCNRPTTRWPRSRPCWTRRWPCSTASMSCHSRRFRPPIGSAIPAGDLLPEEDPYNAFIRRCRVVGRPTGRLAGRTVGLKDNIRLAGVPMTNGSRLLEHYVPDVDAVVVERLLDAGAVIVGKLNMDDMGFAGTSETSAFGVVRNPRNPAFSAGGSSGGSGAAVAAGAVDLALAVDQGGSGRIPASWCGVVALKPTHGLVPSFGITYLDHTIDFVCPLARTVAEVAEALEVIAGDDPRDPQWVRGPIRTEPYTQSLDAPIAGVRLGLVREAMDLAGHGGRCGRRGAARRRDARGAGLGPRGMSLYPSGPMARRSGTVSRRTRSAPWSSPSRRATAAGACAISAGSRRSPTRGAPGATPFRRCSRRSWCWASIFGASIAASISPRQRTFASTPAGRWTARSPRSTCWSPRPHR